MLLSLLHIFFGKVPKRILVHFSTGLFVFFLLEFRSPLYSEYHSFNGNIVCKHFRHSVVCLFHSLNKFSQSKSFFILMKSKFFFMDCALVSCQKSFCLTVHYKDFLMVSSKIFIVLHLNV